MKKRMTIIAVGIAAVGGAGLALVGDGKGSRSGAATRAVVSSADADLELVAAPGRGGPVTEGEDADHYEREYKVAKAQYDAAAQHFKFVDEETREEDVSRATADLGLARAQLDGARARYEKTFLRAPIDGMVLRRYHRAGESVTNSANVPDPLFSLGNRETLRVRVDVDETDVAKVRVGDRAYVTADA